MDAPRRTGLALLVSTLAWAGVEWACATGSDEPKAPSSSASDSVNSGVGASATGGASAARTRYIDAEGGWRIGKPDPSWTFEAPAVRGAGDPTGRRCPVEGHHQTGHRRDEEHAVIPLLQASRGPHGWRRGNRRPA